MPADFDVAEHARGAFGIATGQPEDVEVAFDAGVASYIRERLWHESQTLEERPDGSVVVRMHVSTGWELRAWIKSFLPHVAVLRPDSLRAKIAADVARARERLG
jgi:predicted DNA-binding transcriptional regulator YafY